VRSDLDIPIQIDRSSGESVARQVAGQLRRAIADGMLRAGHPLPSTRLLAQRLGVARSTVVACYLELEGEGWLRTSHGAGTFVADGLVGGIAAADAGQPAVGGPAVGGPAAGRGPAADRLELRPGDLDPRLVATAQWRRSWHGTVPAGVPAPSAGTEEIRSGLAGYLASSRGLRCRPEEIIICAGTMEALLVLALGLGWAGRPVAVEDPGYPPVRRMLCALGVTVVPLDVSDPGTVPARLAGMAPVPSAAYLTPSHQYPLGHRLTTGERNAVLDWSDATGAVLIEDDYDSEFRFDVAPVPSMAGMRPQSRVAYVGTMSKVLDPGLRVAYLRVPPALLPAVLDAREILGSTVPTQVQQAVSRLIRSGELARHIARMRRVYAERRRVLLRVFADVPGIRQVRGLEAGLHVLVELDPRLVAAGIVAAAATHGLSIADLDEFRSRPDPERPGLLISYSSGEPAGLRRAAEILRHCIKNG
jgi:GntR family transcriptional regulator/MocR family aminotransferase